MHIVKLQVHDFHGIESATVELASGLNVLYGPNDLGKSTLAAAIRAVLLLQPGSRLAAKHRPWHNDAVPRVELTFVADDKRYYRVTKLFTDGRGGGAKLEWSQDGKGFELDARGREVDGRLRELLKWGIPGPGGSRGRSLPESFLTKVLLAEQTDVVGILKASIENDPDDSGKQRLSDVLATMAQDPLFKDLLTEAQAAYGTYYTATGQRTTRRGSPFVGVRDELRGLTTEEQKLRADVEASAQAERAVESLRRQEEALCERQAEAEAALARARQRAALAAQRHEAAQQLAAAQARAGHIAASDAELAAKAEELERAQQRVADLEARAAEAEAASQAADEAVRGAEAELARSQSGEAESARQLEIVRLDRALDALDAREHHLLARRAAAKLALAATGDAARARSTCERTEAARAAAEDDDKRAAEALRAAEEAERFAKAVRGYARWHAARQTLTVARAAASRADEHDEAAARARAEADRLRGEAASCGCPEAKAVASLQDLRQQLELAEAALGGGLSVVVRPRRPLALRTAVDGAEPSTAAGAASAVTIEADRKVEVGIDDLVDIEITAGAAEARRAAHELRTRWTAEALPVLAAAGVADVAALAARRKAVDASLAAAANEERKAADAEGQAQLDRERAGDLAAREAELTRLAEAFFGLERARLEEAFRALGREPDRAAARREAEAERAVIAARQAQQKARDAQTRLQAEASAHAAEQARAAAAEADALARLAALPAASAAGGSPVAAATSPPQAVLDAAQADLAALARDRTRQRAARDQAAAAGAADLQRLEAALATAKVLRQARAAERDEARRAVQVERDAVAKATGAHGQLAVQNAALDRAGAATALAERQAALAALPTLDPPFDAGEVAVREQEADTVAAELGQVRLARASAEGQLMQTGGTIAEARLADVHEAKLKAEARQRDVDLDARAAKLLLETLKEAEQEAGTHLGRALVPIVAKSFADLTAGRYPNLEIGPHLTTHKVTIPGISDPDGVLEALSLGTGEQLATLLRLSIAQQLKSAIILDDHLVQADPSRLLWFRALLERAADETQIIVLTCRPTDYVPEAHLPADEPVRTLAAGAVRAIDLARVITRWRPEAAAQSAAVASASGS